MTLPLATSDVFGISPNVREHSYVDRGALDERLQTLLKKHKHIALRGASKCGKSWLRQRVAPNAITVQCRLNRSVADLYTDALSQLDIKLEITRSRTGEIRGHASAIGEVGEGLLARITGAKVRLEGEVGASHQMTREQAVVGRDINDIRFIADLIKASGRRLVIEDFHYMSIDERRNFAFDMKAMWDYGCFIIVVGIWSKSNMLVYLNPDLTARVEEVEVAWSNEDLAKVLDKGGAALGVIFSEPIKRSMSSNCYGNVGILQIVAENTLEAAGVFSRTAAVTPIDNEEHLETALMEYADQLNPLYQQFAERVSSGIRKRQNSTGIYAHAMAAIMNAEDDDLMNGYKAEDIFKHCHAKEARIQLGNLKTVLANFERLQVDDGERGLVLAFNDATEEITAVDRQLLLYRKYATVAWPWEELISSATDEDYR